MINIFGHPMGRLKNECINHTPCLHVQTIQTGKTFDFWDTIKSNINHIKYVKNSKQTKINQTSGRNLSAVRRKDETVYIYLLHTSSINNGINMSKGLATSGAFVGLFVYINQVSLFVLVVSITTLPKRTLRVKKQDAFMRLIPEWNTWKNIQASKHVDRCFQCDHALIEKSPPKHIVLHRCPLERPALVVLCHMLSRGEGQAIQWSWSVITLK